MFNKIVISIEVTVNNIFIKNESINFKILAAKGLILMVHFSICFHNWFIFFVLIFHSQSQVRNQFNAPLWLLVTGLLKLLWPQNCILCFLPSPLVTPISWAGPGTAVKQFWVKCKFYCNIPFWKSHNNACNNQLVSLNQIFFVFNLCDIFTNKMPRFAKHLQNLKTRVTMSHWAVFAGF